MTSWASAMDHVIFGLALCKSKKIARQNCAKNAQIPALGYAANCVCYREETLVAVLPGKPALFS